MNPIDEIRRTNLELLITEAGGLERVAAAADSSSVYLSQIRNQALDRKTQRPRQMGTAMARRLEAAFSKPVGWMDTVRTQEQTPHFRGGTSTISPMQPEPEPPLLTWGESMPKYLPAVFCISAPDDSMAPRVRRGDVLRFSSTDKPRPGDGVLLQDREGVMYFRVYRERRAGDWAAQALNEAFQPLEAERDGLTVLAVLVGISQQRWG